MPGVIIVVLLLCGGCFTMARVAPVSPGGATVRVGKADPDASCRDLGPIEAVHGNGCGGFGAKGVYEGAYNVLRGFAADRGANYVRMDAQDPPHSENGCFDNRFVIRGVAFLCPAP